MCITVVNNLLLDEFGLKIEENMVKENTWVIMSNAQWDIIVSH